MLYTNWLMLQKNNWNPTKYSADCFPNHSELVQFGIKVSFSFNKPPEVEPDDRALKWICLLDSLQQDALQKHWYTQKLKSCFLCKHKLENNFLKIVEAKGKIFKNNNKNLPVSCYVLAECKSHAGYTSWFPCPKGPFMSLLSEASTTLQFPY